MTSEKPRVDPHPLERMILDFAPLVVFFVGNAKFGVFVGTGAFMVAIFIAMLISALRFGRISAMLWISGVMVLVLGGLTIWLHDKRFIQIKPTIYYSTIAAALFFGQVTGRPMLKLVLEQAYPGLTQRGWSLLSRNWAWFFVGMAIGNEAARQLLSFSHWLTYKFAVVGVTVLFAATQIPMLLRHGLSEEDKPLVVPEGD